MLPLLLITLLPAQLTLNNEPELALTRGVAISGVSSWGRRTINHDAIVQMMVDGNFAIPGHAPKAADKIGDKAWEEIAAGEDGSFASQGPGKYVCVTVTCEAERVMLLEASGHAMVYVNAEPRPGDPYSHGYMKVPVQLHKGENVLLFAHAGRGGMRAKLTMPAGDVGIIEGDITKGDVLLSAGGTSSAIENPLCVGIPVYNATTHPIAVTMTGRFDDFETMIGTSHTIVTLPPLSVTKVPMSVHDRFRAYVGGEDVPVVCTVQVDAPTKTGAEFQIKFKKKLPSETHSRTYVSRIDGSVQYLSVVPPTGDGENADDRKPFAMVLSLHGASVEATGQASSYSPKPDMVIACPTNRRPFGFDWEDWGRIDAIEALDFATREFQTDRLRTYLTGHSMGGHGTWQLGVLYPEKFAAIAPSAGWLSFDSYLGALGQPTDQPLEGFAKVVRDARVSSDTLGSYDNLKGRGVYILHGDADDNVPVTEARAAKEKLLAMGLKEGADFGYHEQPGAGHWWDAPDPADAEGKDQPGAACVDWPAMFDMFRKQDLGSQRDARAKNGAKLVESPLDARGFCKGSFKRVFDRKFVLVHGTKGTPEVNAWAFAKARFDAEQWWYRGNGYAQVISDAGMSEVVSQGDIDTRNVILYGTPTSNSAWKDLVPSHVKVSAHGIAFQTSHGVKQFEVIDEENGQMGMLLAFDVLNGAKTDYRTIAIVTGTSVEGCRALDRLPIFLAGTGVPSQLILRNNVWTKGHESIVYASLETALP